MIETDSYELLDADARRLDADPAWLVMAKVSPGEPAPQAVPAIWRYADFRPLLDRATRVVDASKAERRVLMLTNPGIKRFPFTTDTIYAGLQVILPGEYARPHRHNAFALRFIIEGDGAFTAVDGTRVMMASGDLLLTPSFTYHDHGNESAAPMVWLDGLDTPLYQHLPVHFTEPGGGAMPTGRVDQAAQLRYPWTDMQARLDNAPGSWTSLAYTTPAGAPISRTIGAKAERLAANATSPRRRETTSTIYHVRSGSGETRAGDTTLAWKRGDTFAVPAWTWFAHRATGTAPAYLFRYDDSALLEHLGAYRAEVADAVI
jgi:gentisate 1,2-dioxygenase